MKQTNSNSRSYHDPAYERILTSKKKGLCTFRNAFVLVSLVVIGSSYLLFGYRNEIVTIASRSPSSKGSFNGFGLGDLLSSSSSSSEQERHANASAAHDGLLVLGAPRSNLYYLSSFLSSSGYRVTTRSEPEGAIVVRYEPSNRTAHVTEEYPNVEPFERVDSLRENKHLLSRQNLAWDSPHLYRFNNTLGTADVREDGFLETSHMVDFLDGIDEADEKPWLWQDPQLCVTFPAWLESLRELERPHENNENATVTVTRRVAAIFSYEHPLEVARSLRARSGKDMPLVRGLRLWLDYNYKCFVNIQETNVCTIFTSQDKLRDSPSREINRILRRVNSRCGMAPGAPGMLRSSDSKRLLRQLKSYEKKRDAMDAEMTPVGEGDDEDDDQWHEEMIMKALGLWSLKDSDCDTVLRTYRPVAEEEEGEESDSVQSEEKESGGEHEYDFGSPSLANAINELTHLENAEGNTEDQKESFRQTRDVILTKLTDEIELWAGTEYSDSIHQLVHFEREDESSLNKDAVIKERIRIMSDVKRTVRSTFGDALAVYCGLENGDAMKKEYIWPQQLQQEQQP